MGTRFFFKKNHLTTCIRFSKYTMQDIYAKAKVAFQIAPVLDAISKILVINVIEMSADVVCN